MAILFITHDLGVIAEIADDVLVMYRGEEVEYGPVLDDLRRPQHPVHEGAARVPAAARHAVPAAADGRRLHGDATESTAKLQIVEKQLDRARLKRTEDAGPRTAAASASRSSPRWGIRGTRRASTGPITQRSSPRAPSRCCASRISQVHFPDPPRPPGPRRRPCEGGRRHQLQRLPRADAGARRRDRAAARRRPAGRSCGSSNRPAAASISTASTSPTLGAARAARNCRGGCRSSFRIRTARSTRG